MRHLALAAILALSPTLGLAQQPESPAETIAMTTVLRVCWDYVGGLDMESAARRAESGGFRRQPDRGGVLGESLTWRGAGRSAVHVQLNRGERGTPATCVVSVTHGEADGKRLAAEVEAWALGTRPAFTPYDRPPSDPFADVFGAKPVSRKTFERLDARLKVERYEPTEMTTGADLLNAYSVVITLERSI
jgi:hypothetical protein